MTCTELIEILNVDIVYSRLDDCTNSGKSSRWCVSDGCCMCVVQGTSLVALSVLVHVGGARCMAVQGDVHVPCGSVSCSAGCQQGQINDTKL